MKTNCCDARRLVGFFALGIALSTVPQGAAFAASTSYPIVDTGQHSCYDNSNAVDCPAKGKAFFGQDAQYQGAGPRYVDNGDGTVTDEVTGLMWAKEAGGKIQYADGVKAAKASRLAGHDDWRVPTIKELFSLMDFSGVDPLVSAQSGLTPFVDTRHFGFAYGDTRAGQRIIDLQWITSTLYGATVMGGNTCFFGVNFADGRIKCYPTRPRQGQGWYLRLVRGNPAYGTNDFRDKGDGTVADRATGLLWQKADSGKGMPWGDALSYCEDLTLAGREDWRLPNAKELQSIVDYSRAPDTTGSAALDPIFKASEIKNEAGKRDWPFYWSSTTHRAMVGMGNAVYVAFGRALGNMREFGGWVDVHGAGAQRSDPKSGSFSRNGRGPQGDAERVNNYVRCVSGGASLTAKTERDTLKTARPPQGPGGPAMAPGEGRGRLGLGGLFGAFGGGAGRTGAGPGGGRTPPREAISACALLKQGHPCSFQAPMGQVSGICRLTPDGAVACVPR